MGVKKAAGHSLLLHQQTYAAFFLAGTLFYYAVNCGRKYKKGNLKDHLSRSGVQEARCQKNKELG